MTDISTTIHKQNTSILMLFGQLIFWLWDLFIFILSWNISKKKKGKVEKENSAELVALNGVKFSLCVVCENESDIVDYRISAVASCRLAEKPGLCADIAESIYMKEKPITPWCNTLRDLLWEQGSSAANSWERNKIFYAWLYAHALFLQNLFHFASRNVLRFPHSVQWVKQ